MTFLCGIYSASPEDDRNKLKIKIIELLVNAVYNCKMSIRAELENYDCFISSEWNEPEILVQELIAELEKDNPALNIEIL